MSEPAEKPKLTRNGNFEIRAPDQALSRNISDCHFDSSSYCRGHQHHADAGAVHGSESNGETSDDIDVVEKAIDIEASFDEEPDNDSPGRARTALEQDFEAAKLNKTRMANSKLPQGARNPNLVTWEGPGDPQNPKNWSSRRKWVATIVVSSFTIISPVSSSMIAPALLTIAEEFNVSNKILQSMPLSIFVLGFAIGPLCLGPLSEMYGRVIVLQTSNLLYLFFNLGCGLAQSKIQIILFRFLAGLGGSAPLALGGGVLSDLFIPEQRGKAFSVYSLAPLLGPALGPVAGGFIAENTTWRWVFYATTIADGLVQISGLFLLQETYPPVLLQRKRNRLTKETGNSNLYTEWDDPKRTITQLLKTSLSRPFRLLGTQIIIQLLAIYMAYLYGVMYLVLSTFPTLWTEVYHESISIGGLNYISLSVGLYIGTQICAPLQDRIYLTLKKRNNGVGRPEFRVPLMIPGALCVPLGLFWYGWTAQAKMHWILPDIGVAIFGAGIVTGFQCTQTYIVDSYPTFAASAVGAVAVLRSLAGFGFPLFAPYIYQKLHYGWGNSLLGLLTIVLGWPVPFLLWKYGEPLRKRSTYAAG